MSTTEPNVRKALILPESMWEDIEAFRASERISTTMEAVRRLLTLQLKQIGNDNAP